LWPASFIVVPSSLTSKIESGCTGRSFGGF
jgi:hypothetical protein